jgi:hypothetical protein
MPKKVYRETISEYDDDEEQHDYSMYSDDLIGDLGKNTGRR